MNKQELIDSVSHLSAEDVLSNTPLEKVARLAVILVLIEFKKACEKFPAYNSAHEGMAVIEEEIFELWEEIRKKEESRDQKHMLHEAVQVASCAIRFITDICMKKNKDA